MFCLQVTTLLLNVVFSKEKNVGLACSFLSAFFTVPEKIHTHPIEGHLRNSLQGGGGGGLKSQNFRSKV